MNAFLFFRYGIQMFFFLIWAKSTNIENKVQIQPILYFSQPITLQIFFRVSDNDKYFPRFSYVAIISRACRRIPMYGNLGKYFPYCTRHSAITTTYCLYSPSE